MVVTLIVSVGILTTGFSGSNALFAQEDISPVQRVDNYYQEGRLDQGELEALRLLNHSNDLTAPERAELYKILAFISIARNDPQSGRSLFIDALSEMPNLRLDRGLTSPKILSVFDEARSDFRLLEIEKEQTTETDVRPYKLRLEGGKRSLLLPGWGQLHKGHKTRGYTLIGLTTIAAGGLIVSHLMMSNYESDYNSSTSSQEALDNWDKYESAHSLREVFGYSLAAVWLGATLDAFITEPILGEDSNMNVGVGVDENSGMPVFRLAIRF